METSTDRDGRFHLDDQFFSAPVTALFGDPHWGYSLCVRDADQWQVIFTDGGIPAPPVVVDTLDCDLAAFHVDSAMVFGTPVACRAASHRTHTEHSQ